MTRIEVGAYAVFAGIVGLTFVRASRASRDYGARLRRVRLAAAEGAADDDIDVLVYELASGVVTQHTGKPSNENEVLRVAREMPKHAMLFEHMPDAEDLSHIVAFYRVDDATHASVAYAST